MNDTGYENVKKEINDWICYNTLVLFLYSVILTEYVGIKARVCVCACVFVCHLYIPNEWTDFKETLH